jgi:hypothetical protein
MKTFGFAVVRGRGMYVVTALLCAAGCAAGQSQVYEGFNYAQGPRTPGQMSGGTGWSGAFAGSASVSVEPASLTAPAALPTSGRSIRWGPVFDGVSLTRNFASSFSATDEVWMSFIYRMDDFPSGFEVRMGGASGPGVGNGISGVRLYRGDGSFQFDTGQFAFGESFMLVRFGPDSGGTRSLSVWANPAVGALGAPLASVTAPSGVLGSVYVSLGYATAIDEIRVDRDLANVFVPSGGAASLLVVGAGVGVRRRR